MTGAADLWMARVVETVYIDDTYIASATPSTNSYGNISSSLYSLCLHCYELARVFMTVELAGVFMTVELARVFMTVAWGLNQTQEILGRI